MINNRLCITNHERSILILLSTYNGEKYIKEQIDSILSQTVPVHLLIRDDGSSDDTPYIIAKYAERYSNIELIRGRNLGFVGSFNSLISSEFAEKYEWIAFCDQDHFKAAVLTPVVQCAAFTENKHRGGQRICHRAVFTDDGG